MQEMSKSKLIEMIRWAVSHEENLSGEYFLRKQNKRINISISILDPEIFTDENGIKWIRA